MFRYLDFLNLFTCNSVGSLSNWLFSSFSDDINAGANDLLPSNSKTTKVQTKDDTTQCISVNRNNGSMLIAGSTQVKSAVVMSAGPSSGRAIDRGRARRKRLKRRGQPFCLRATLANFSTFCQQTSLHGWQYIAQKNSSSAKHMFWAVVVSMSMATAALFLYNNTMDYLNATVSANFYLKSDKGQLISECLFGFLNFSKKQISALESK